MKGPTLFELARQALSSTEQGYDRLAPKFDATPFRTPDAVVAATLAYLDGPVDDALDVCCGTGAALFLLRAHARRRVVGIDLSRGMLAEAERRMLDAPGQARVELLQGDVLDMPFDGAFDAAVSFGAFGHILRRDEPRFLASLRRSLRPGGRFLFATAERPPLTSPRRWLAHGFNAAMRLRNLVWRPPFVMYYLTFVLPEVRALLEEHGFEVLVQDPELGDPFRALRVVIATRRAR
jgi:ubiquinone/menaquinone biosynthesis C-methylase UbiE